MLRKRDLFISLIRLTLIFSIWLTLFVGATAIWAFLNLPETESIKITRQPSITFLDRQEEYLLHMVIFMGNQLCMNSFQKSN